MKKALFSVIAALVIAVSCFVVPASADETAEVTSPVLSGTTEFYKLDNISTVRYDILSSILRNHMNGSSSEKFYLGFIIDEKFYLLSSANPDVLANLTFTDYSSYGSVGFNTSCFRLKNGNSTFSSGCVVSNHYMTAQNYWGFDENGFLFYDGSISRLADVNSNQLVTFVNGKADYISSINAVNAEWAGLIYNSKLTENISDYEKFSSVFTNDFNGASGSIGSTSSTAEIMTAPQSETDKADGGHLKVSQSQAANGYTAFSFMLNDNSNYHSYSVKISSNINQLGTIEQRILNENGGSINTGGATLTDIASVSNWLNTIFNVWAENNSALRHFDFEYMFNQNAQTDSALKNLNKSWLSSMCKNMNSLTYITSKVLTFDELSFSEDKQPYLPCKVVSFALSDYINVNKDTIYKVEIIDNVTQTVLDYTYIATPVAMSKGGENYGTKVYNYKEYNTMKNDVINNDPSNAYTSSNGGKMEDSDPDNGFNSGTIQGIYDKYSINDLSDALNQSVSNATGFVKMCTSLIPPEIMALIVGGIALLILLRVLGR